MKIQSINSINFKNNNSNIMLAKTSNKYDAQNFKSIYSSGMSSVSFYGITPKVVSSFEKEIAEQPKVLKKLADKYFSKADTVSNINLNLSKEEAQNVKRIQIIASGSSKNSAEMAKDFIEQATQIPVSIESASEFINKKPVLSPKEDLMVYVSQSGNTADTFKALRLSKEAGVKSVAITNNPDSKIYANADANLLLETGEEKAVAATKTVTSSIFNLMAMGLRLGEVKGALSKESLKEGIKSMNKIPSLVEEEVKSQSEVKKAAKIIAEASDVYYYAKGSSVGAAKEGALKLTETTGKRVIADSSSEALHGMFASIKSENPVLQIISGKQGGIENTLAKENINEVVNKRGVINPIIIKSATDHISLSKEPTIINIPQADEVLTPLLSTVRFQQITNEVTKIKGINPDNGGGFLTKYRGKLSLDNK